ncbi:hypothetical protein [Desulfosarcina variabilis]|uniref:hypothetical protein n=1 Tax=Desulfosarcina variabilis TaxID=2300 RepID=UPI003AFB53F0
MTDGSLHGGIYKQQEKYLETARLKTGQKGDGGNRAIRPLWPVHTIPAFATVSAMTRR